MNLTINDAKTDGLNAVVARLNAIEGAEQISPEQYLTERVNEILDAYNAQEIERVKAENAEYFNLAANLSPEKREQIKNFVQELAKE
jgi:hypothetical protein